MPVCCSPKTDKALARNSQAHDLTHQRWSQFVGALSALGFGAGWLLRQSGSAAGV